MVITDPRAPRRAADVLEGGGDPRGSRHLLLGVLGLVLLVVAVQVLTTVRDRRAADVEERRVRGLVELEQTARFERGLSEQWQPVGDSARVSYAVGVRNEGPREVEVVRADLGELQLGTTVRVPAGADRRLELVHEVGCASRPADGEAASQVTATVRSQDGVEHPLALPAAVDADQLRTAAARACRYVSPGEATFADPFQAERTGDRVDARFALLNLGRTPVRVVGVDGAGGLVAELRRDGESAPVAAPVVLPPKDGSGADRPVLVVVRLGVQDCALVPDSPVQPLEASLPVVAFRVSADGDEQVPVLAEVADPSLLRQLVDDVC